VIDLAGFRTRGPEFKAVADARIEAALDAAELRTDADYFGDHTDSAHYYLAAHLVAAMPQGKAARLKGEGFQSLYMAERERLERMCAMGAGLTFGGC
jgi:hypothetical protein